MTAPRLIAPLTAGQRDALRHTLTQARALPVYRPALAAVPATATPEAALAALPVFALNSIERLTQEVLEQRAFDFGGVEMTSGTTGGRPKRRVLSEADLALDAALVAALLHATGVRADDRVVAVELAATPLSAAFLEGAERLGARFVVALAAGGRDAAAALVRMAPDTVIGPPSVIERLLPALLSVCPRLVVYNGDRMADAVSAPLAAAGTAVRSLYGLTETSALAVECASQAGLHLCPRQAIAETRPVDGADELLVTTLGYAMPLLRYPTGDLVRVIEEPCPCGLDWPRVSLLGRRGEQFSLFEVKLTPDDIAAVLPPSDQPYLQIVLSASVNGAVLLTLRLPAARAAERQTIRAAVHHHPLLDYLIATGAVQVRLMFVTPPSDRKPPRVVDRRQAGRGR